MPEKKEENIKSGMKVKILIGLATVVLITFMFPRGESIESELTVGAIWTHEDLIAPFSFPIKKDPKIYQDEVKSAVSSVFPVFVKNQNAVIQSLDSLKGYDAYLQKIIRENYANDSSGDQNPTFLSDESFNTIKRLIRREHSFSGEYQITSKRFFSAVEQAINDLYKKDIIIIPDNITRKDSIAVRTGNFDNVDSVGKYLTIQQAENEINRLIEKNNFPADISGTAEEYASHFIFPVLVYNPTFTQEEIAQARSNVSKYSGIVNENERIIAKHERITKETKLKIESYKAAKGETLGAGSDLLQMIGKGLHIAFLLSLLTIYLFLFRKKIFYDNRKIFLFALNFVFLSFITFLINQISVNAPIQFFIFIPVSAMLLTIIFDSRVGFYSTVILCLVTGALRGNDYSFMAMNLFASALSVYTVRDIKNRSQIFRSFLFILLGYVVSISAFGLERFAPAETYFYRICFCRN